MLHGTPFLLLFASLAFTTAGCSILEGNTLSSERYMTCPQESVWEGALEILEPYPVTLKDQSNGIIETGWLERPVTGRPYGLFAREGLGERERSRLTFTVKPIQDGVVVVRLTERRQHWGFRGGNQIYKWYPVEPSKKALDGVMNDLTAQLDKDGCFIES